MDKWQQKKLEKEMGYMKNLFNAASSLTALGNTFDKKGSV
jgi:hypothetical protein